MGVASSTVVATLSQAGLGQFPIEILMIIGAWILLSIFGFTLGTSRLDALALTFLTTTFFIQHLSYAWGIGLALDSVESAWLGSTVATGILVVLCYIVFLRLCDSGFVDGGGLISSAISAFATVVIILALWATSFATLWPFPELIASLFVPATTFWWLLGGLVVLAIARQKRMWG